MYEVEIALILGASGMARLLVLSGDRRTAIGLDLGYHSFSSLFKGFLWHFPTSAQQPQVVNLRR